MKSLVVLVAFLGLSSSLKLDKLSKGTYANYAAENGIVLAKAQADYQYLDCYDRFNQQGTTYRVNDYTPDLSRVGMDNRFSSCCFYGIWNLFDDYEYSERNPQVSNTKHIVSSINDVIIFTFFQRAVYSGWGEGICFDLQGNPSFDNLASSVRFVGAPDGYKYDTLNLYEYDFYRGYEQYTYGDASSLNYDNLGRSIIVTGCQPWTVYQNTNFNGNCACVYPSDTQNCYPGFYESLGNTANQISSVRKGCYCNKKMAPQASMTTSRSSTQVGGYSYQPAN